MSYVQAGDNSGSGVVDVTLTGVTNGNYLVAFASAEGDVAAGTITTQSGSTGTWNDVENQQEAGDFWAGRLSYAVATATGDVTIRLSDVSTWNALYVVEMDNIDSFDSSDYARDTSNPRNTPAGTPGSYDAMLVGFVVDWSGAGSPTNNTGWSDIGPGMDYSGTDIGRAQYRLYSSGTAQASFNGNTVDPCFVMHAIFIESSGPAASGPNLLTLLGVG